MRVISGIYKGKKILGPIDKETRPLKDITKESIFNIINHSNKFKINLFNSHVLDLFSGVGSFGIECLSRGAEKVVFYENYPKVLTILKKNLLNLKKINNYEIIEQNIYDKNTTLKSKKKFDIIFLDPPYKDKSIIEIFLRINYENLLNIGGIIILHRHKSQKDIFPAEFKIIYEKKYGLSKILFISQLY